MQEDIFEWQFAIHGPRDSEFEGGVYHGRIILPAEYPFKPPAFMLLTVRDLAPPFNRAHYPTSPCLAISHPLLSLQPSGRFEVQTKICLSISQHHPEHWQPSWSVRTALVALIAFLPTKADGALGSLEYTKEERQALAATSRLTPPKFGSATRQAVINQLHQRMLDSSPPAPAAQPPALPETTAAETAETAETHPAPATSTPQLPRDAGEEVVVEDMVLPERRRGAIHRSAQLTAKRQQEEQWLSVLVVGLLVAILAIVGRKILRVCWGGGGEEA